MSAIVLAVALAVNTLPLARADGGVAASPVADLAGSTLAERLRLSGSVVTPGWNVTIRNKGDTADYPASVRGGDVYVANVSLTVEVPPGQVGTLRIEIGGRVFADNAPVRYVDLGPVNFTPVELGPGTHFLDESVRSAVPVVYRDSYTFADVLAWVLGPGTTIWEAYDTYGYDVDVRPVENAVDVVLRATVRDRFAPSGGTVVRLFVTIDQVLDDPSNAIRPGKQMATWLDRGLPRGPASDGTVEIRGDYHPSEDPKVVVWKDSHYVRPVGAADQQFGLLAATAAGLAVATIAVVAYRQRRRRRRDVQTDGQEVSMDDPASRK